MSILNQFRNNLSGDGAVSVVGKNGFRASASISSRGDTPEHGARLRRDFPAIPGITYCFIFDAKVVEGTGDSMPFVGVDYPSDTKLKDRVELSYEWESYSLSFTVPFDADPKVEKVTFATGVFTATAGIVELANLKFTSDASLFCQRERFLGVKCYSKSGSEIDGVTLDVDVSRVGEQVTITLETNISKSVDASTIYTDFDFLPLWAEPVRKSTQFCTFSTASNAFTAIDVKGNDLYPRRVAVYKRMISNGIETVDFGVVNEIASLTYVAKGLEVQ